MTAQARETTPLVRESLSLAQELTERLDGLAKEASRALGRNVPRTEVIRIALTWWLEGANNAPPEVLVRQLRASLIQEKDSTAQHPMDWPTELTERIDRRRREASFAFACQVSRMAIVWAAVTAWLVDALERPREAVIQAIRAGMVGPGGVRDERR